MEVHAHMDIIEQAGPLNTSIHLSEEIAILNKYNSKHVLIIVQLKMNISSLSG